MSGRGSRGSSGRGNSRGSRGSSGIGSSSGRGGTWPNLSRITERVVSRQDGIAENQSLFQTGQHGTQNPMNTAGERRRRDTGSAGIGDRRDQNEVIQLRRDVSDIGRYLANNHQSNSPRAIVREMSSQGDPRVQGRRREMLSDRSMLIHQDSEITNRNAEQRIGRDMRSGDMGSGANSVESHLHIGEGREGHYASQTYRSTPTSPRGQTAVNYHARDMSWGEMGLQGIRGSRGSSGRSGRGSRSGRRRGRRGRGSRSGRRRGRRGGKRVNKRKYKTQKRKRRKTKRRKTKRRKTRKKIL